MGKELAPDNQKFTLKPADIFVDSTKGDRLNDLGMACQGIIFRQREISNRKVSTGIKETLEKEVAELCQRHKIPKDALPVLGMRFGLAVQQQFEERMNRLGLEVQQNVLAGA